MRVQIDTLAEAVHVLGSIEWRLVVARDRQRCCGYCHCPICRALRSVQEAEKTLLQVPNWEKLS